MDILIMVVLFHVCAVPLLILVLALGKAAAEADKQRWKRRVKDLEDDET